MDAGLSSANARVVASANGILFLAPRYSASTRALIAEFPPSRLKSWTAARRGLGLPLTLQSEKVPLLDYYRQF